MGKKRNRTVREMIEVAIALAIGVAVALLLMPMMPFSNNIRRIIAGIIAGATMSFVLFVFSLLKAPKDEQKQ